jgi:drug/metabolite transporter (DMT)-like permease
LLGFAAVVGWAFYAALVASAGTAPRFLMLAVIFSAATATLALARIARGKGFSDLVHFPIATLLLGVMGLAGANILQVFAFGSGADPYSVAIVTYVWPILMVAAVALLRIAHAGPLDWLGIGAGFAGVGVITLEGGSFSLHPGLVLAFFGTLAWAVYSALRTLVPAGPRDSMIAFVGVSGLICWALHFASGEPFALARGELVIIAIIGIVPVGLANLLWDIGARHGDPVTLAGLSYLEPVLSMAVLFLFLGRPVGPTALLALILVMIGGALVMIGDRRRSQRAAAATVREPVA